MSSVRDMEQDLLALSDQYTWAAGDDATREDIRVRYRELHARWMAAKSGSSEPLPAPPPPVDTLF